MISPSSTRARLKEILRKSLQGRASHLLLERLFKRIDAVEDESSLRETITVVRVAVRMFVDEELGEQVTREMEEATGTQRKK